MAFSQPLIARLRLPSSSPAALLRSTQFNKHTHRKHSSRVRSLSTSSGKEEKVKTFDKILIANRGEIACRIIRTCRKMGIKTVAIYSDPDIRSMHVRMADEAVRVGPAASAQSYLNIENVVNACRQTGAQAVHPGYGFLSEKHIFAEALAKANITFIGPPPKALTSLGDKLSSKHLARQAGVNTVPGGDGPVGTSEEALKIANKIGYPVMVKASAGGGGKGMRVAWNDKQVLEAFRLCKAEAKSSFADDTMLVEKFIDTPRHIEIQILADGHGNVLYINERECSIQRRNQKVLEEAPSMFLDPKTRKAMGEQAASLAKLVGYQSAGTCEFLVDPQRNFYFLEMNTRLQVEHPVTEEITGFDLVGEMIKIAAGHPLKFRQADVPIKGWSVEARVYAEDPLNNFMPSIGKLARYVEPKGPGIRIDSGISQGDEISIHYDPMISKLITHANTRGEALEMMRRALDEYVIHGVTHNIAFLREVMDNKRWTDGDISTKFIPNEYPQGFKGTVLSHFDKQVLVNSAVHVFSQILANQTSLSGQVPSFDRTKYVQNKVQELYVIIKLRGEEDSHLFNFKLKNIHSSGGRHSVEGVITGSGLTPQNIHVESEYRRGDDFFTAHALSGGDDGKSTGDFVVQVSGLGADGKFTLQLRGTPIEVSVYTPREYELLLHMPVVQEIDFSKMVISPMPGAVVSVAVKPGDQVVPGQEVCVIEAMKMQNALYAQSAGKVKNVFAKPGTTVNGGDPLVELE